MIENPHVSYYTKHTQFVNLLHFMRIVLNENYTNFYPNNSIIEICTQSHFDCEKRTV